MTATIINGEIITEQAYREAGTIQRMAWRWNALVEAHDAAAGFAHLLGRVWTGQVMEVAAA